MTAFKLYKNHRYLHSYRRGSTCVRCGVKRRASKSRTGRTRRIQTYAGEKRSGRWQYKPPCSGSWQFEKLPCGIPVKESK